MLATNALAAFSVPPARLGSTHPMTRVRVNADPTTSAPPQQSLSPRNPEAPPPDKLLPRGSLLDLSV